MVYKNILLFLTINYLVVQKTVEDDKIGGALCDSDERYKKINTNYMVSLRKWNELEFYQHICGGTLLSRIYILSAAQCLHTIKDVSTELFAVEKRLVNSSEYVGPVAGIEKAHIPKTYSHSTLRSDIVLLRLKRNVIWGPIISVVLLPKRRYKEGIQTALGKKCPLYALAVGFGTTDVDHLGAATDLLCSNVRLLKSQKCTKSKIENQQKMCIEIDSKDNIWVGDTGGPIICDDIQWGIISSSLGSKGSPFLQTRTDAHLDIIHTYLGGMKNIRRNQGNIQVVFMKYSLFLTTLIFIL